MRSSEYEIIWDFRETETTSPSSPKVELLMAVDAMRAVRRLVKSLQAEYADVSLRTLRIISVTPRQ